MAISRFQSAFKVRTDMMDNITPNNTVQMNASVPAGEWKPAAWLPTIWQNEASKDFFVISSGKVVSLDATGRVVPSGLLRRALDTLDGVGGGDVTSTIMTYTLSDVDAKVVDIRTGTTLLKADVGAVSFQAFAKAILENEWVDQDAANANADVLIIGNLGAIDNDEARSVIKAFISAPVGIAAYDVYVWAGDDAANLNFTNYQKQHLIQFFTDIQMRVGHVCNSTQTEITLGAGNSAAVADIAAAETLVRYKTALGSRTDVVCLPLHVGKIATPINRTGISASQKTSVVIEGWAGRERSSIDLLAKKGDYFIDADAGNILFFNDQNNGAPLPGANHVDVNVLADGDKIKVHEYSGAVSASEQMQHFVGDCRPGDFVTFDKNSNFKVLSQLDLASTVSAVAAPDMTDADAADGANVKTAIDTAVNALRDKLEIALEDRHFEESLVVGRVLAIHKEPRGLLERVRTGWSGDEFGADAKMPGSATQGFSDLITLSDELIADEIVIVNVKIQ